MKKQLFSIKDLISAGLFSLLVFAAMFIGGITGFIPIFMPFIPFACVLCSEPVFIFYSTKTYHFGMVLIMGTIIGLLFMVTGRGIRVLLGTALLALIGEYTLKKGSYENLNRTRWCFTVYSLASGFMTIPIYITCDAYIQRLIDQGYSRVYAGKMMGVLSSWTSFPVLFLGAIGGYLGATIGIKILQKRFKKLGVAQLL